jgi:hypothetical protein
MFGHGQIEGYTEKYGMEYRWPRYQENPDHWLVERHQREIAPLLKRRWIFAESADFLLYDVFQPNGSVNEDVFAYSNRSGHERALVVYHNRYGDAHGTIHLSAAYADKGSGQLRQRRLAEGFGFSDRSAVLAWRDSLTGLEYLRRASDLADHGLTLNLRAYQCYVFLDWRELYPTAAEPWDRLADMLNGRGVPSLGDELVNLELRSVHDALSQLLTPAIVHRFADAAEPPLAAAAESSNKNERKRKELLNQIGALCEVFLHAAKDAYAARLQRDGQPARQGEAYDTSALAQIFNRRLRAALRLAKIEALFSSPLTVAARHMLPSLSPQATATQMWGPVLAWCVLQTLAEFVDPIQPERTALDLFDRLRLRAPFAHAFAALGFEGEDAWRAAARIKVLLLAGLGAELEPALDSTIAQSVAPDSSPVVKGTGFSPHIEPGNKIGALAPEGSPDSSLPEEPDSGIGAGNSLPVAPVLDSDSEAGEGSNVTLASELWLDPDVRWLCGVHDAEGHVYLVRERYEELLWWLLLPSLLRMATEASPNRAHADELSRTIAEALDSAAAAGYRVSVLIGSQTAGEPDAAPDLAQEPAQASEPREPMEN